MQDQAPVAGGGDPVDPDIEIDVDTDIEAGDGPPGRPLHLRTPYLLLVGVGGGFGTAAREGLSLAFPDAGFPLTIFLINITGAFALGLLLELLVRLGSDAGHRRTLRLLLGTGFMGGYTTYSTFAIGATELLGDRAGIGWAYAAGTVVVGAAATTAGILAGALAHRRVSS